MMYDMKNKIISFLAAFTVLLSVSSCGLLTKILGGGTENSTDVIAGQSMFMVTHEYSTYQLDSMCVADGLPKNLDQSWISRTYLDYETREYISKYMYIKELNNNYEMIYTVTPKYEMFIVSKREVKEEENDN